jgi:NadR type nicotinamide-nucleotide adenylyltransferase
MAAVDGGARDAMSDERVTRIVVTGSESTGKTTLARDLAAYFGVRWVPEQARSYAERVRRELTADDVAPIASEQITAEDAAIAEAIRRGDRWLFLDTDLVSTVVYARHYYGSCPAWIEAEARARRGDLYLLADIDLPWLPDGVRDRPRAREQLHGEFRATLAEFRAEVCVVRGSGDRRLTAALDCLSKSAQA